MRVLLIEDDLDLQRLFREALHDGGHQAFLAMTYEAGDTMLGVQGRWDAVITNIRLPGAGDGFQLALKAQEQNIPVLVIAGHHEDVLVLQDAGIEHLAKPFPLDELLEWLERHVPERE